MDVLLASIQYIILLEAKKNNFLKFNLIYY